MEGGFPSPTLEQDVVRCLFDCIEAVCSLMPCSIINAQNLWNYFISGTGSFVETSAQKNCGPESILSQNDHDDFLLNHDNSEEAGFSWEAYSRTNGFFCVDPSRNFEHVNQSLSRLHSHVKTGQIIAVGGNNDKHFCPCVIEDICGDWLCVGENGESQSVWKHFQEDCFSLEEAVRNEWKAVLTFDEANSSATMNENEVEQLLNSDRCVLRTAFESKTSNLPQYAVIQEGCFVDVQEIESDPRHFWSCRVLKNVGGRLLLEYVGAENEEHNVITTFWEFYTSEKVHPVGSAAQPESKCLYGWEYVVPAVDMKLEALHPIDRTQFFPASITEIINDYYFVVELDTTYGNNVTKTDPLDGSYVNHHNECQPPNSNGNMKKICHRDSPDLFPVGWCAQRRLRLAVAEEFDWTAYIKKKGGKMMHEHHFDVDRKSICADFRRGQKLECVYPSPEKDKICVATVIRFVEPLVWIAFDCWPNFSVPRIFHCASPDLLPGGWCQAFDYPLIAPNLDDSLVRANLNKNLVKVVDATYLTYERRISDVPSYAYMPRSFMPKYGCQWAPAIYLNPSCYVGPYICRSRFSEMPRRIGPGPLTLVLKNVLRYLISSAYRPRDLFGEFQPDPLQTSNPYRETIEVKAKYRGKRYRGPVEICTKMDYVEEWCRQLCNIIDACPNVVTLKCCSPNGFSCPYQCSKAFKSKHAGKEAADSLP